MSRRVYFRKDSLLVRVVLDEDFDETPLYADAIDAQTGQVERDNRLIEQVLNGEICDPLTQAEVDVLTNSPET
jgi:hypothetical protein